MTPWVETCHPSMNPETFQAPTLEELSPLFPNYSIDAFIAQGGMGAVYLGTQLSLERPVAIKILPRHLGADEEFRTSFSTEAKSMAKLNHPNLIGVYDFGEVDGMPFIVMEYVPGKSLHDSSYGKQIDASEASRIVIAISRGLHHAHEQGILHRDVKPANILLDQEAKPKLGDFGLAMASTGESDGLIYGTPGYAAPEVYAGNPDHRSDVYAAAVMLYQLLTGEMPEDPYRHPSQLVACDKRFDRLLSKALQPALADRHKDAEEFAQELENILTIPTARAVPLVATPAAPVPLTALPSSKKSGAPVALIATLLAVVAGGIGFMALSGQGGKERTDANQELAQAEADKQARAKASEKERENQQTKKSEQERENARQEAARAEEKLAQQAQSEAERKQRIKKEEQAAAAKAAEEQAMISQEASEKAEEKPVEAASTFDHEGFLRRGRDYCRQNASRNLASYHEALLKNIESLEREGKAILRDEEYIDRDTERARKDNLALAISKLITLGRLPKSLAEETPEAFSDLTFRDGVVSAAIREALDDQAKLDADIETTLKPLLVSYLAGVRKQATTLADEGNQVDAEILEREAAATEGSFPRFLAILQGEDLPAPLTEDAAEELANSLGSALGDFNIVGEWKRQGAKKEVTYTMTKEKTILLDGGKAKGTWEKAEDGIFKVLWGNGLALKIVPRSDGTLSVNDGLFTLTRIE